MRKLDPSSAAVLSHFGSELRRYREAASMSRDALGRECWVSGSLVKAIERAERIASQDFTQRAEKALGLGTGGPLSRLWEEALWPIVSRRSYPEYFQAFSEIEAKATQLRQFEPLAVPGLLQTADYARALLARHPDISDEQVDEFLAARTERQAVLDGDEPPVLVVLIDESVLGRTVGDYGIMRAQLAALADACQRPKITVQVVPTSSGADAGLAGSFVVASLDGADRVYYETAAAGQVIDHPGEVATFIAYFESLRGDALSSEASLELIRNWRDRYDVAEG